MSNTGKSFYIKHAILEDYRSIRHAEIEFKPGLNIVIGKNGSGKTNVINFIEPFISGNLGSEIPFAKAQITFQGSSIYTLKMRPFDNVYLSTESTLDTIFSLDINNTSYIPKENKSTTFLNWWENFIEIEYRESSFLRSTLIKHGIPSSIGLWNKPFASSIKLKGDSISFNEQQRLIYFGVRDFVSHSFKEAFSGTVKNENIPITQYAEFIKSSCLNICSALSSITKQYSAVSDIRLSPDSSFSYDEINNEFSIRNFHFDFFSEGTWRKFSELSDGTQRIVFILSELSLKNFTIPNKAKNEYHQINFIEEPELGIHPHQLDKLMNFLKEESETKQIILTTHSPQVLNVLEPDELDRIIICEYDNEKGTQLRHMTEDEKSYAQSYMKEQFLSDFWLYSGFNDDEE